MKKKLIIIIEIIVLIVAIIFCVVAFRGKKSDNTEVSTSTQTTESTPAEKWEEGVITYDGQKYKFNEKLKTYLFMGIDKDDVVKEAANYQDGGQSDSMILLVVDSDTETIKLVYINRNSMTDIEMFDEDGNALGTYEAQICVAHGFGDGKQLSCNYAVEAVEGLFNQIPIDGYLALNVAAVPVLNDYVGGVDLEVLPGVEFLEDDSLVVGETVHLDGELAYKYLRRRSTDEDYSADERLARHQQYMSIFLPKLMEKVQSSKTEASNFYLSIQDYIVTNIDAETVINELSAYQIDLDNTYSVPGETVIADTGYEEYHVDSDGLYQLIIDVFYQKVEE